MPYRTNSDLPPAVQRHLPPHAMDIYREAFNNAFAAHADDPRQEEAAHRHRLGRGQTVLREGRRQLDRACNLERWPTCPTRR
jgi:cation transport regulator